MRAARVGVFVTGLATFVSGVLLSAGLATAENATGVVFHDANSNGVQDGGESGVHGALVTNGLDVVQTDADGRYTLSVTDETIISIVKPAGYKVPVDKDNLPYGRSPAPEVAVLSVATTDKPVPAYPPALTGAALQGLLPY